LDKIGDDKPGLAYHQVAKVANEMGLYKLAIKVNFNLINLLYY
jgi:hypothetical protein